MTPDRPTDGPTDGPEDTFGEGGVLELEELVAALQADAPGPHPAARELLAYRDGTLDPGAADAVQEHLAACRACTAVLLDLADFAAADAGELEWSSRGAGAPVTPFPAGRHRAPEPPGGAGPQPEGHRRGPGAAWLPRLAAAVLLLVSAGLLLQVLRLDHRLEERSADLEAALAAQGDVPLAYLDPVTRSEAGPGAIPVELPPAGVVVLVVGPEDPDAYATYTLEVTGPEGVPLVLEGLRPSSYGTLRAALPARRLQPGLHRVRLMGRGVGGAVLVDLATYALELTPPRPAADAPGEVGPGQEGGPAGEPSP